MPWQAPQNRGTVMIKSDERFDGISDDELELLYYQVACPEHSINSGANKKDEDDNNEMV